MSLLGGGVLSLSKEIRKIRHSTLTLLLTTITEVLKDAHMVAGYLGLWGRHVGFGFNEPRSGVQAMVPDVGTAPIHSSWS